MALIVCTWKWGNKYPQVYVDRLADGLRRYLRIPHSFVVFSPVEEDIPLTEMPGCFARLRMFSRKWQREVGIKPNDQVVCMDLDLIIVRKIDMLFNRPESLVILGGANSSNPCPYNGSVLMFRAGCHEDLWEDFSVDAVRNIPHYEFPDDQGWLWHKYGNNVATWQCGPTSGIYAFRKVNWPPGDQLPQEAKIVVFPGRRDPAQYQYLPWIRKNWTDLV